MNDGEKQELLIKIYLTHLRDNKINTEHFGIITTLGFNDEYKKIRDKNINFLKIENDPKMIIKIAEQLEIQKSNPGDKADVKINKIAYSLKCIGFSNPAIVNHTNRYGWLKIAERKKFNIEVVKYDCKSPIQIINYEQLDNIDVSIFSGNYHQVHLMKQLTLFFGFANTTNSRFILL